MTIIWICIAFIELTLLALTLGLKGIIFSTALSTVVSLILFAISACNAVPLVLFTLMLCASIILMDKGYENQVDSIVKRKVPEDDWEI